MRNLAKFEIIGRIGRVDRQAKVTHMTVAANYPYKDDETNEWKDDTYWNRVTVFNDNVRSFIDKKAKVGDLVRIEGRLRDASYQKAGDPIYTVDRIADTFGLLATKAEGVE